MLNEMKYLIVFAVLMGANSSWDLTSIYFRMSAVIQNKNFTSEFLNQHDCSLCKNLEAEIEESVWGYFDFLMSVSRYRDVAGSIVNRTTSGQILFGSPRKANGSDKYLPPVKDTDNDMKHVNERGIYFIFYMKVTFNMSNPEKNKHKVEKYTLSRSGVQRYFKNGKLYPTDLEIQTNLPSFKVVQQSDVEGNFSAYLALWPKYLGPDLNVDATIPDDHRRVLKVISYVGCACSAIGLLLTILTVGLSRKLRRIRANQILLQLCIALLAAILLFVFGTQNVATDKQQEICKVLAAFLHYFLLSSIVWMSIQAYNLYQDIVKVFNTTTLTHTEFMIRASVVGWVIPGVVVMVTGLVKSTSYGVTAVGNNTGTYKCWMDEYSFYGAFLTPVLLLMLLNTVAFVMVMREVVKIPHKQEKSSKMGHFKASLSIFVLLGLNWLFSGLAATDSSVVFWYLFTITCSFQGFLIFVMHGIIKKDFQEVWKALTYTNRVLDTLRASDQKTSSSALPQSSTAGRKMRSHSANGNDWDSGIDVHVNSTTRDNSAVDRPNGTRV